MNLMSCIQNRRSIRKYTDRAVTRDDIRQILTAASWAPSGNNLQPWRFFVVMENEDLKARLAALTVYNNWVSTAPCLIAVFLDTDALDNNKIASVRLKHSQAIGAAIQNMLLMAHDCGLGTCWIGEILKNQETVRNLLAVPDTCELMAVIALGYPEKAGQSTRRPLQEVILGWC